MGVPFRISLNALVHHAEISAHLGEFAHFHILRIAHRNPLYGEKGDFFEEPAAPSLNLAYVLFRMGERGGGYPYDCVNAVELPPHEIAGDFRLSAAHFHEKRAGFQARKLFNSPLLIRI